MPLAAALVGHNPACEECVALRESLAGTRWDALDDAWLELHEGDLALLTGTAFRYYLPAFLLRVWRAPAWSGSQFVVYGLDPRERGHLDPWMVARLEPLKPEQRAVVRTFLEARRDSADLDELDREEARDALAWWAHS